MKYEQSQDERKQKKTMQIRWNEGIKSESNEDKKKVEKNQNESGEDLSLVRPTLKFLHPCMHSQATKMGKYFPAFLSCKLRVLRVIMLT